MSNGDDGRLLDLLEEWERRIAAGEQLAPEDFTGADRQLAEELKVAMRDLAGARWLDQEETGDESIEPASIADSLFSASRPSFAFTESTNGGSDDHSPPANDGSASNGLAVSRETPTAERSPVGHRYEILSSHAHGGLGVVYRASDREFGREVALKSVRRNGALDEIRRAKFRREAMITGCLEHPGIVPVYSLGVDDRGEPYYAMRLVQGENLKSCLDRFHADRVRQRRPLDGAELRGLLRRFLAVCDAVGYAHDRGVVHRDLKPGNIMLGTHGETLVVDWGLAKRFREPDGSADESEKSALPLTYSDDSEKTADGTLVGTPAYAPPEQLTGRNEDISPASDVYSLGVVLYEILTGSRPVEGESLGELVAKVEAGEHVPARERLREVPVALDAICRKAYAVDPSDRYASANLLKADVEAWLDDRPVLAKPDSLADRCFRWSRRHPALATGWSVGLVVVLLAAAAALWIDGKRQAELNAAEREKIMHMEAAATAEAKRIYSRGEAILADLLAERREGWTLEAKREISILREMPFGDAPAERTKLASAEWTASLGRELIPESWSLDKLAYQPYRAILSPDKKLLALPQSRASARLHSVCVIADAQSGEIRRTLRYSASLGSISFQNEMHGPNGMRSAGFSADGAWIAVTSRYGSLLIWELGKTPDESPLVLESGTSEAGEEVVWLEDGTSFVAAFDDELQLWTHDGDSFRKAATATIAGRSSRIVQEPETDRILFVVDGKVRTLESETLKPVKVGETKRGGLPTGSGFVSFKNEVGVEVIDLAAPAESFNLIPYDVVESDARIRPPVFSSDGTLAVMGVESDDQNTILLVDAASGEVLSRQKVDSGNDVLPVFADDETVLLVENRGVSRWRMSGVRSNRTVAIAAQPPLDMSWAAEGGSGLVSLPDRIVALGVGSNGTVLERQVQKVPGDWRVRFSPAGDRALLLTVAEGDKCKIRRGTIDASTGELLLNEQPERLPECEQAVWSADGESLWVYLGEDETRDVRGNARIERRTWPGFDEAGRWHGPTRENVLTGKGQVQALTANDSWVFGGFRSGKLFCLHTADATEANERIVSEQRILAVEGSSSGEDAFAGLEDGRLLAVHLPELTSVALETYENSVVAVDLSADGARLLSATAIGRLVIRRRDGAEWRTALETRLEKPIVNACWADRRGETLCVRLEHERGVRLLRVPQEIWSHAAGGSSVASEATLR